MNRGAIKAMTEERTLEEVAAGNERSLKTLARAIAHSRGEFSLILARCPGRRLQALMEQQLRERCELAIQKLVLKPEATTLLFNIQAEIGAEPPEALMVLGLESVAELDELLRHSNRVRDQFRDLSFPLVLWVTEAVLQKMIWLAPDFKSFATRSIQFQKGAGQGKRILSISGGF